jgi:hypothetical protein
MKESASTSADLNEKLFDKLKILGTDSRGDVKKKWREHKDTTLRKAYDTLIGLRSFKDSKYYLLFYCKHY